MATILFIFSAILFYYVISIKTKDYLHPLGLGVLLWFLTAGLSNINVLFDSNLQKNITLKTNIVIFLSGIFFIIPVFFSKKLNKNVFITHRIKFDLNYRVLFNILMILSIISFIIRFNSVLFYPPFLYVDDSVFDLKSVIPPALPGINLFDVLTPFLAVLCLFELLCSYSVSKKRKITLIFFILYSVCVSIFYKVSRGELIILLLAFVYLYSTSRKINFTLKRGVMVSSLVFLFVYLGVSRIPSESRVSTQFGDGFLNMVFSQIYTYIAMNFQNLNTLINSNFEYTYFWGAGKFIIYPFFKSEYDSNFIGLTDHSTEFFNAKTYIYYFYNDLGLLGALLYSLIIGCLVQFFYNLSITNIKFFSFVACLLKAIFFMFFGNYFFGDNIIFIPYILILILILMMRQVRLLDFENKTRV